MNLHLALAALAIFLATGCSMGGSGGPNLFTRSTLDSESQAAAPGLVYGSNEACIGGYVYTNDVLPKGVGEFETNGLDDYWNHMKTRKDAPTATWGPGYVTSWGRHQYDTYFANEFHDSPDWPDPIYVGRDTAVAGSPNGIRIMAEPVPSPIATSLKLMDNDQWIVTSATEDFKVPSEGASLTVNVANPNGAQNNWRVGIGYKGGAITFIGTLTSGGAAPSGNGTGGSNPWTISNVHVYSGAPGTTIVPGQNDEGGMRAYYFPQYYSSVLDTNVNQEYGFFVARLRLPPYLPALSPAFWTLETGGVADPPSGLQRDELDIEEMFAATSGNALNAGDILWNTSPSQFWPTPTGIYNFPHGTPQHDYHDYGVLQAPGSTTFYLDGRPISEHENGPDWTQGSSDKEVMLMFQVGSPGSWLDPNSQGMKNHWPQYLWAQWMRIYKPTSKPC